MKDSYIVWILDSYNVWIHRLSPYAYKFGDQQRITWIIDSLVGKNQGSRVHNEDS